MKKLAYIVLTLTLILALTACSGPFASSSYSDDGNLGISSAPEVSEPEDPVSSEAESSAPAEESSTAESAATPADPAPVADSADERQIYADGVANAMQQYAAQIEGRDDLDEADKTALLESAAATTAVINDPASSKEDVEQVAQSMFDLAATMNLRLQSGNLGGQRLCDVLNYPTLVMEQATGIKEEHGYHIGVQYNQVCVIDSAKVIWYDDDVKQKINVTTENGVDLLPEGHYYSTYIYDGKYSIYDLPNKDLAGWIYTLAAARTNEHISFYEAGKTVKIWDVQAKTATDIYDAKNGTLVIDGVTLYKVVGGQQHQFAADGKDTYTLTVPRGVVFDLDPDEIIKYDGVSYRVIEFLGQNGTTYEILDNGGVRVTSGKICFRTATVWDENNAPKDNK